MSERWSCPLVVELDGTLSKIDSVGEGIVSALLRRPSDFLGLLAAFAKGRRNRPIATRMRRRIEADQAIQPRQAPDPLHPGCRVSASIHIGEAAEI